MTAFPPTSALLLSSMSRWKLSQGDVAKLPVRIQYVLNAYSRQEMPCDRSSKGLISVQLFAKGRQTASLILNALSEKVRDMITEPEAGSTSQSERSHSGIPYDSMRGTRYCQWKSERAMNMATPTEITEWKENIRLPNKTIWLRTIMAAQSTSL